VPVRSKIASNSESLSAGAPLCSSFSRGRSFSGQFLIDILVSLVFWFIISNAFNRKEHRERKKKTILFPPET
jgi:branched-subunit amino acid permease